MWESILGGIVKNGTVGPTQIQPDKGEQQTTIALYILAGILVIVMGWVLVTVFTKGR